MECDIVMRTSCVKNCLVVGVILLFIGAGITPSVAVDTVKNESILISSGNTLYVGGTEPGNYTTIQSAINAANPGDTVFVYDDSSPYYENVEIANKSINLIGENRNSTIITGNYDSDVIIIFADNVSITGFTIRDSKYEPSRIYAGIKCYTFKNIEIFNNIFINNMLSIAVIESQSVVIENNIFRNDMHLVEGCCVFLQFSSYIFITENNYFAQKYYVGGEE